MRSLQFIRTIAAACFIALTCAACGGAGFDPPQKLKGLRVLAVQKDNPYPRPSEKVNLTVLYWDQQPPQTAPRNIDFQFCTCTNPPGDLYYNCYKQCGLQLLQGLISGAQSDAQASNVVDASMEAPSAVEDASPDEAVGDAPGVADDAMAGDDALSTEAGLPLEAGFATEAGLSTEGGFPSYEADHLRSHSVTIAPNAVHGAPPGVTPYGLVYVLFTACAGHIGLAPSAESSGLPVACYADGDDHNEHPLGPEDFVPGYSSIYVYDDELHRNHNPVVRDFLFDNASIQGSPGLTDDKVRHIPHCTGGTCQTYDTKVVLDQAANQERDPGSTGIDGQPLWEQMWLALYTTAGDFDHPLRLVNDASAGWNDDNGSKFISPTEPGPVRIWAVVHDNRGGVAWVEGKIIVD